MITWNGIAPFNAPYRWTPWEPAETVTIKYVTVNGTCEECKKPFTREVSAGNASRINLCGGQECKAARQRKLNKRSEMRKRERKVV